jgi:hypothetical protein
MVDPSADAPRVTRTLVQGETGAADRTRTALTRVAVDV